jgi:hypothetical protein
MSTRPGEGFQQEAAEAYKQTNRKRAEKQVCLLTHINNFHTHSDRPDGQN